MRRYLHLTIGLLALTWFSLSAAAAGIDKPFSKLISEETWGEKLADAVGFGGFSKSYALVIGISDYAGGYGNLPTGNDAKRVADYLFKEAGFDYVHLLTEENVTKARVAELMSDEFPELLDDNDRFFFYWSGHGDTRAVAAGDGKAGYLPLSDTPSRKWSRMIAMEDVQRWNRFLPAQHSLFLLDACFSGLAGFVQQSPTPRDWKIEQLSQPGHHLMSAGTENEKTIAGDRWGGSLFTTAVLDGLRGKADAANGFEKDSIISLTELKAYVQDRVLFERQAIGYPSQITPQVRDLRHNAGEFFFLSGRGVEVTRVDARSQSDEASVDKSDDIGTLPPPLTPEQIESTVVLDKAAVQRSLSVLGYNPGVADGILGPRSRANIRAWQSANGFEPSGYLTAEQYETLLRDAETRVAQAPVVRQTSDVQSSPIEPAVGLPSYEPLTSFRDCGDCPEMVVISAGSFIMGSRLGEPHSKDNERPGHKIELKQFAIGKYEVTFEEWNDCVAGGGCSHKPLDNGWGRGSRPVIAVSWRDAQEYVEWLSKITSEHYRLPSESEWEYAARSGTTTPFAFGVSVGSSQANFGSLSSKTVKVGSYSPNQWGLYDMHGNVSEWIEDRWHNNYVDAPADGTAWTEGGDDRRVLRGGSHADTLANIRSASRDNNGALGSGIYTGFRVAKTLTR